MIILRSETNSCAIVSGSLTESIRKNGTLEPSTANLIALAELFGVSVDEMLREM